MSTAVAVCIISGASRQFGDYSYFKLHSLRQPGGLSVRLQPPLFPIEGSTVDRTTFYEPTLSINRPLL